MNTASPRKLRFLVEWYRPDVDGAVFDASTAQAVADVCDQAGIPAQRLTPAVDARFPSGGP
jgi:hypothetical protein